MAEVLNNLIFELKTKNHELNEELRALQAENIQLISERDEALTKAWELAQWATYVAEQGQRKGLVSIPCAKE